VDDDVGQLREFRHEPVFHDVGGGMRRLQRYVAIEPEVQIQERVVRRAPRANLFAANHAIHRLHDVPDFALGQDDLVSEDPRRFLRDAPARVTDEPGDEQRRHRVE